MDSDYSDGQYIQNIIQHFCGSLEHFQTPPQKWVNYKVINRPHNCWNSERQVLQLHATTLHRFCKECTPLKHHACPTSNTGTHSKLQKIMPTKTFTLNEKNPGMTKHQELFVSAPAPGPCPWRFFLKGLKP